MEMVNHFREEKDKSAWTLYTWKLWLKKFNMMKYRVIQEWHTRKRYSYWYSFTTVCSRSKEP